MLKLILSFPDFPQVNSYKSHLKQIHKDRDLKSPFALKYASNIIVEDEPMPMVIHVDHQELDELVDHAEANRRLNALYILKTKEVNLLTQKCVDNVVEDSTELVRTTVKAIRDGLQNCLDGAGIALDAVPGIEDLFTEHNHFSNPFEHVSTKCKQASYFKEQFGLVVSDYDILKL